MSSKRGKRIIAAGVALAATTGTAVAFTGQPGANSAPKTDGPDLISVTLDPTNAYGDRQAATFCFDTALQTSYTAANFFVKTYDANRFLQGQTASVDPGNGACVIVTFNPQIDLATQGSLGEVDAGAVQSLASQPNYFSSAPLMGSSLAQRPGQTTGPDLLSATPRQSDFTVEYVFDQQVDRTAENINAGAFGVVDNDGTEVAGASLTQVDTATSTKVRITFPNGTNVQSAARYFNRRNAVRTLAYDGLSGGGGGNPHAPTTTHTLASPGAVVNGTPSVTRPVLNEAVQQSDGSSQFILTYSTDLNSNFTATDIIAVRDNGEVEAATSSQPISGSTTKRLVSFANDGAVDREPSGVVKIVSQTGAAKDAASGGAAPISAANVGAGAPMKPGFTNGPDLLNTVLNGSTSQAAFVYDEAVDPTAIGAPGSFRLLVANGNPISGISQGGTSSDRKTVTIGFPGSIEAGVGVTTGLGATQDRVGNLQQYTSVSSTETTPDPNVTPARRSR